MISLTRDRVHTICPGRNGHSEEASPRPTTPCLWRREGNDSCLFAGLCNFDQTLFFRYEISRGSTPPQRECTCVPWFVISLIALSRQYPFYQPLGKAVYPAVCANRRSQTVCSETERITNLVMNRHDYDRLAQRISQVSLAEWERDYKKDGEPSLAPPLHVDDAKTAHEQPDNLATPRSSAPPGTGPSHSSCDQTPRPPAPADRSRSSASPPTAH